MSTQDQWDTGTFSQSPIISQLQNQTQYFQSFQQWPQLSDYQALFKQFAMKIRPVAQASEISCFEEQYEPRVFLKQELQTRTENWHDFFNAMVWLKFPHSKQALNQRHYEAASQRATGTNRSTLENRLTQFDECGAIIVASSEKPLQLIRNHQWQTLFIEQASLFKQDIRCIVFGHAIFEKALAPYIGMTCHCLMLADPALLAELEDGRNEGLDRTIADYWLRQPTDGLDRLQPLPLLGIPGYWPQQDSAFYANEKYFRK
ncbi:MAG TPA: DUF3025 domain-containing protein [Gammaproteobacteria bacterium]